MTPAPLDAKPQGAQLKRYTAFEIHLTCTNERMDFFVANEAAERIEKLERELHDERESHAALQSRCFDNRPTGESVFDEVKQYQQQRDTALRALAEAGRDAERYATVRAKFYDEILDYVYHYDGSERSPAALDAVIDAARQPEKDANNG